MAAERDGSGAQVLLQDHRNRAGSARKFPGRPHTLIALRAGHHQTGLRSGSWGNCLGTGLGNPFGGRSLDPQTCIITAAIPI
eukprot:8003957-Karenia_brevis.AAC.1